MVHRLARTFGLTPFLLVGLLLTPIVARGERMTPEKLFELRRIGDAALSPDGKELAYLVTSYDLAENSSTSSLLIQPVSDLASDRSATGFETPLVACEPRVLLEGIRGLSSLSWIRRPEGDCLLYIAPGKDDAAAETADQDTQPTASSAKLAGGKPQAWIMNPANGANPKQITFIAEGIANLKASPQGDKIAFTVSIKLDATANELYADLPKADARIIDSLMYRHWNAWHDYTYSHVHVARLSPEGVAEPAVDLMEGMRSHCPLPPFGGPEQFAFSPDGQEIALTIKAVDYPAESTDSGIYLVPLDGGSLRLITPEMPGYDLEPRYSANGRFIAFHSMSRPGFEADRNRIIVYDRSQRSMREVTAGLDQTAHEATWSPDDQELYFSSETRGTKQVYSIPASVLSAGAAPQAKQRSSGRFDFSVVAPVAGSRWLLVKQQNMLRPTELALLHLDDQRLLTITDVNGPLYATLELPKIEERFFTATDGKQIQAWVILPPDDAENDLSKWPMLTFCQGGPQGQIGQSFSFRWNFHLMAARGYVVLAPNRRGLPGFGQAWNDQISGDWGGQAMQDILSATDGMIQEPRIDPRRIAAVGASFGGYTVYWLMGNAGDRFCSMISHCGVFNLESMYGSTEELFFVNWDMGGPYWNDRLLRAKYDQFSPHRYVGQWKTPLLVIHGEKDFRVPITQGMEAFTAAQVQRVPSRFLYFPDEGHWVTKPQNSVLWQRVFFDWLDRYCQTPP